MQETTPYILVGYRFMPTDEELVEYYLYQKVSGIPIPFGDYVVKECDIYGDEPGKIWNSYGGNLLKDDEDLYFFTKLKKRTPKSSRIDRKVGLDGGAWQGEDAPTEIVSSKTQRLIGSKKRFRYEKEGSDDNGCWIMHEYTLHASLLGKNQSTNCVLCRIRKNQAIGKNKKSGKSKKRKLEDFQKSTQSVEAEPERLLTKQDYKQVARIHKVESQSSEASMVTVVQEECDCGIDYSSIPGAGQCEAAVPDQSIQALTMVQSERMLGQEQNQQQMFVNDIESRYEATSEMMRQKILSNANSRFQRGENCGIGSNDFAEQCKEPVVVVPDYQILMLQQENEYDPLSGISDEDMCLLHEMFNQHPNEESVTSASVDWVTLACTEEKKSDHSELLSEEFVFVPNDDGESACAGSTSSSADMRMNGQSLPHHGCGCEGIIQRSGSVVDVPTEVTTADVLTAFPDHTMAECRESTYSVADFVMMEQALSSEECGVVEPFLFEENYRQEEQFYQENFTKLLYV